MATYFGYARVSTKEQSDFSIDDQLKFLERQALSLNLNFVPCSEKESGFKLSEDRTMLWDDIIPRLSEGDVLGVIDYSRLSRRGAVESRKIADQIIVKGAKVQINGVFYDPANPDSDFLFDIHSTIAKYYLAIQKKKSLTGIRQKRESGNWILTGRLFGYDIVYRTGSDKQISINEVEAKIIRIIFQRYTAGSSLNMLQQYLNQNEHQTKTGKLFTPRTVQRILLNPIYAGYYLVTPPVIAGKRMNLARKGISKTDLIKSNCYPAIISIDEFFAALDSYKNIRRTRGRVAEYRWRGYFLTGLIKCGNCEQLGMKTIFVHGWSKPRNSKTMNPVYTSRLHVKGCSCMFKTLREPVFNDLVRLSLYVFFAESSYLNSFISDRIKEVEKSLLSESKVLSTINADLEKNAKKLSRAKDRLSSLLDKSLQEDAHSDIEQEKRAYLRLIAVLEDNNSKLLAEKDNALAHSQIGGIGDRTLSITEMLEEYSEHLLREYSEDALDAFNLADDANRRNLILRYLSSIKVLDSTFRVEYSNGLTFAIQLEKNRGRRIQRLFMSSLSIRDQKLGDLTFDTEEDSVSYIPVDGAPWERARAISMNSELMNLRHRH